MPDNRVVEIRPETCSPSKSIPRPFVGFATPPSAFCPKKGVSFSEIDVWADPERKPEMIQRANGGRTVPQIFIGDTHVGGCDDLYALERAGKLDDLLAA